MLKCLVTSEKAWRLLLSEQEGFTVKIGALYAVCENFENTKCLALRPSFCRSRSVKSQYHNLTNLCLQLWDVTGISMSPVVKLSSTNAFVTDTETNSEGYEEQFPPFRKVSCRTFFWAETVTICLHRRTIHDRQCRRQSKRSEGTVAKSRGTKFCL